MKRVTSRAMITVACISGLLIAGTAMPHAFGTTTKPASEAAGPDGPSADDGRRRGAELSVKRGRSESARISRPSDRIGPNTLKDTDVKLTSYDAEAGRAVLGRSDRAGGDDGIDVRKGDVIASPPTEAAPEGALVKVEDVTSEDGGKAGITTSRAALTEVFGGAKADGKIPVSPSEWKVDPLVEELDVARGAAGAGREANGKNLHLDFGTGLPGGDEAGQEQPTEVDGYLDIAPKVDFSYDGHGSADPRDATASLKVAGAYKGRLARQGHRRRIRFRTPHPPRRGHRTSRDHGRPCAGRRLREADAGAEGAGERPDTGGRPEGRERNGAGRHGVLQGDGLGVGRGRRRHDASGRQGGSLRAG
ncbi:hypothetical protein [Streptomyces sp. WMMB 322]|uniref:hypothetical protein n=1 Tax=Streptomyces sp. WMMB 322 TaxID=1286821 RepID=UPI000B06770C|nr:hypothetical protein [Streptomyces sp. WMMB 322]